MFRIQKNYYSGREKTKYMEYLCFICTIRVRVSPLIKQVCTDTFYFSLPSLLWDGNIRENVLEETLKMELWSLIIWLLVCDVEEVLENMFCTFWSMNWSLFDHCTYKSSLYTFRARSRNRNLRECGDGSRSIKFYHLAKIQLVMNIWLKYFMILDINCMEFIYPRSLKKSVLASDWSIYF